MNAQFPFDEDSFYYDQSEQNAVESVEPTHAGYYSSETIASFIAASVTITSLVLTAAIAFHMTTKFLRERRHRRIYQRRQHEYQVLERQRTYLERMWLLSSNRKQNQ